MPLKLTMVFFSDIPVPELRPRLHTQSKTTSFQTKSQKSLGNSHKNQNFSSLIGKTLAIGPSIPHSERRSSNFKLKQANRPLFQTPEAKTHRKFSEFAMSSPYFEYDAVNFKTKIQSPLKLVPLCFPSSSSKPKLRSKSCCSILIHIDSKHLLPSVSSIIDTESLLSNRDIYRDICRVSRVISDTKIKHSSLF